MAEGPYRVEHVTSDGVLRDHFKVVGPALETEWGDTEEAEDAANDYNAVHRHALELARGVVEKSTNAPPLSDGGAGEGVHPPRL